MPQKSPAAHCTGPPADKRPDCPTTGVGTIVALCVLEKATRRGTSLYVERCRGGRRCHCGGGAVRCPALGIYSRRWWPRSGWRIAPVGGALRHHGCCSWAVRRVNVSASAVIVSGRLRRREKVSLVGLGRGVPRRHLPSAEGAHRFGPGGVSACVGSSGPVCSSVVAPR